MTEAHDYETKQAPAATLPDLLCRRLYPPIKRLNSLAVSRDGRIALALSSTVSVLSPLLFLHPETRGADLTHPGDVRTPLLGHEVVYEAASVDDANARKDTVLGKLDIASIAWGKEELFIIGGDGTEIVAKPDYDGDGSWGGILGGWKIKEMWAKQREKRVLARGMEGGQEGNLERSEDLGQKLVVQYCRVGGTGGEVDVLVVGTKKGVYLYRYDGWEFAEELGNASVVVGTDGWSGTLACVEGCEWGDRLVTMIAVGYSFGKVVGYVVWHDEMGLHSEKGWEIVGAFGPVNCLSWSRISEKRCRLLGGVGNSIVIADLEAGGVLHVGRISEAHRQLVTGVEECVDGSIVSGSMDGSVYRWNLRDGRMEWGRIRQGGGGGDSVMGVKSMGGGMGIVVTITSRRVCTEVGGGDDAKYAAGARRSQVSLYASEMAGEKVVDMVESGTAQGGWEVFSGEIGQEGMSKIEQMVERLKGDEIRNKGREEFERYAARLLSLTRVASMDGLREELQAAVWASYYDGCLQRFLARQQEGEAGDIPWEQGCAIEAMCQVICVTAPELLWSSQEAIQRAERARTLLCTDTNGHGVLLWCTICKEGGLHGVPLVFNRSDICTLHCTNGDTFARCLLTGLPVTSVAARTCQTCSNRAETCFAWTRDLHMCPHCRSYLLPNHVHGIY